MQSQMASFSYPESIEFFPSLPIPFTQRTREGDEAMVAYFLKMQPDCAVISQKKVMTGKFHLTLNIK